MTKDEAVVVYVLATIARISGGSSGRITKAQTKAADVLDIPCPTYGQDVERACTNLLDAVEKNEHKRGLPPSEVLLSGQGEPDENG